MAKKVALLQGNEACAQGALYAGCKFFGGYPITPSTEVAEVLSNELPKVGGKFIQMEDEIGAIASVIGASLTGSKALTATSGPGVSLKQELIGYACIAEVPCVIINVMRGGPSTGMPTGPGQSDVQQAKWGTHGDHAAIALRPASCQEIFTETVRAFNLAEKYRMPVQVLYDEIVGHMRERIEFPEPGEARGHRPRGAERAARAVQALRHLLRRRAAAGRLRLRLPLPRHRPEQGRGRLPDHQGQLGRR